jgi:MFS family permease
VIKLLCTCSPLPSTTRRITHARLPVTQMDDSENAPLLSAHTNSHDAEDSIALRASSHDSKSLAIKIAAAMFSFSTLGLFNSSIGAALPLIRYYYHLTDLHVSLIFLVGPVGYILAAQFSETIHNHFGQRGIALIGPILQSFATLLIALHPRFEWVLVAFAVQGLGTGLLDGSWCAWAGNMEKANTISGLLHGSYSVGGAAGPFFVAIIATKHDSWYIWYYVLVRFGHILPPSQALTNCSRLLCLFASCFASSLHFGRKQRQYTARPNGRTRKTTKSLLGSAQPIFWRMLARRRQSLGG